MNSTTGTFTMDKNESLVGGFTKSGKLKFVNSASNSGTYDGFAYVAQTSEGYLILGDQTSARICGLNWDKHEEIATSNYVVPSLEKASIYGVPFNFKKAVRERQNPFLNIVPKPMSSSNVNKNCTLNSCGLTRNCKLEESN